MTGDLMRKLEQVAHDRRGKFFPEIHEKIAVVSADMGGIQYYARFEGGRYLVYKAERGVSSAKADVADVDHAILLIGLLADDGFDSEPRELRDIDHVIKGDSSITDGQLASIIDRHIDPRFYSLGAARNSNGVWLRVGPQSHAVMYRDPDGTDGVILSYSVSDGEDPRAYDVGVVCNYAWCLQYAWQRILNWGFTPDDPQLTPILHRVMGVDEPLES